MYVEALYTVPTSGDIAGAGLDVLGVEPAQCFRKYPTVHVKYGHDE